jgi:hypothetical protein
LDVTSQYYDAIDEAIANWALEVFWPDVSELILVASDGSRRHFPRSGRSGPPMTVTAGWVYAKLEHVRQLDGRSQALAAMPSYLESVERAEERPYIPQSEFASLDSFETPAVTRS